MDEVRIGEVLAQSLSHLLAQLGESEAGLTAVEHPVGVLHFAVSHQVDNADFHRTPR